MSQTASKQIVLSHFGRSGSTVLAALLKQHSKISWLGEYFSIKSQNARNKGDYDYTQPQMKSMILDEVEKLVLKDPDSIVGHEIKLINFLQNPSCSMIDYVRGVNEPEIYNHIVLRRRNTLKRICSVYKARDTKIYHVPSGNGEHKRTRFAIDFSSTLVDYDTGQKAEDISDLISKAQEREAAVLKNYRNSGVSYLEIFYEDHIEKDPTFAYDMIIEHLGLEAESAKVNLSKTSAGLKEDLENYDELKRRMRGSPHEWMIEA